MPYCLRPSQKKVLELKFSLRLLYHIEGDEVVSKRKKILSGKGGRRHEKPKESFKLLQMSEKA